MADDENFNTFTNVGRIPPKYRGIPHLEYLVNLFNHIDSDNSGMLDWTEFYTFVQINNPRLNLLHAQRLFNSIDTDRSGKISLDEFITAFTRPDSKLHQILNITLPNAAAPSTSASPAQVVDSRQEDKTSRELTAKEMSEALKIFQKMDVNQDDSVSLEEMVGAFQQLRSPISRAEIEKLFHEIDADRSGTISVTEFLKGISLSIIPASFLAAFSRQPAAAHEVMFEWEIQYQELKIGNKLGEGAFGVVYSGTWHGAQVAIKELKNVNADVRAKREFQDEVAITSKLRHPNIVLFLGASVSPPKLLMVTEFCRGGTLGKIRQSRRLRSAEFLKVALNTALGLNYLHLREPPIVHRDLKPDNILLDDSFNPKIADFGLAEYRIQTGSTGGPLRGTPVIRSLFPLSYRIEFFFFFFQYFIFLLLLIRLLVDLHGTRGSPKPCVGLQGRRLCLWPPLAQHDLRQAPLQLPDPGSAAPACLQRHAASIPL
eukprot:TRINITY_DN5233_c0_g1_i1.p1 TRINITY_DN5233_c0_g1~~TRINITY_DN5233_c0_g1_i1.p1  ORF type:complete len:486 (+),score=97.19 TRINITY_DN5233_c0_g1_i1:67-1524(+)